MSFVAVRSSRAEGFGGRRDAGTPERRARMSDRHLERLTRIFTASDWPPKSPEWFDSWRSCAVTGAVRERNDAAGLGHRWVSGWSCHRRQRPELLRKFWPVGVFGLESGDRFEGRGGGCGPMVRRADQPAALDDAVDDRLAEVGRGPGSSRPLDVGAVFAVITGVAASVRFVVP
jgi:hypothetical protein